MTCPTEVQLSSYCDGAQDEVARRKLDLHLRRCESCRVYVETEQRYGVAFDRAICPDPETLGLFVDDRLPAGRLEGVAAHVLACEPCREVVSWTREGQQRVNVPGKRRRLRSRRRVASEASIWLGVAAAAAVLLAVVLFAATGGEVPDERGVAQQPRPADPRATASATDEASDPGAPTPDRAAPDTPDAPDAPDAPSAEVDARRGRLDSADHHRGGGRDREHSGDGGSGAADSGRPSTQEPPKPQPARRPPVVAVALAGADLIWRGPDGVEAPLRGRVSLPAGSEVRGRREGGAFSLGEATCLLVGQASVSLEPGRLTLVRGEALVEGGANAPEFASGDAVVRADGEGARILLDRAASSLVVCVVSGRATIRTGGDSAVVEAGQVQRARGGRLTPLVRGLAARLERSRALSGRADRASWVEVPRGVIAQRSLRAAARDLQGTSVKRRAEACLAVEALLSADPHLASLPAREGDVVRRADEALTALLAEPAADLAAAGAVPAVALALISRGERPDQHAERETPAALEALGEALANLPLESLASDGEAMFALRAIERATKTRAFRGLWRGLSARVQVETLADLERALLCGKKSAKTDSILADLDARLAGDDVMSAEALGRAQRVLVLARTLTTDRAARLLAKAADPGLSALELAPLLSGVNARALGVGGGAIPAATVAAVKAARGYRVTFTLRTQRRGRQAYLVGSWDDWAEETRPMTRTKTGAWTTTLALPSGHHEYKIRFSDGKWEIDALNPVSAVDPQGNRNSAFDLD